MKLQKTSQTYVVPNSRGTFHFTVSSFFNGDIIVSDIKRDSVSWFGAYPKEVQTAITEAIQKLESIMNNLSSLNGTVTLNNASTGQVLFNTPLQNTNYRVLFTVDDFVLVRVTTRTTTGFTFEIGVDFTGDVKYDILF
jgi:hypothetical protein